MKAFTCHVDSVADTVVAVFEGDNCNDLTCITDNDDYCDTQSVVLFDSIADKNYYIFVTGKDVTTTSKEGGGEFFFSIVDGTMENDSCSSAFGPLDVPQQSSQSSSSSNSDNMWIGNLIGGTSGEKVDSTEAPLCGSTQTAGPGQWFLVFGKGNGQGIRASTCNNGTSVPAQIAVYDGPGTCTDLSCKVGLSDDPTCKHESSHPGASTISWKSEENQPYYIFVYVENSLDDQVPARFLATNEEDATASFSLSLGEFQVPANDECDDAIQIEISGSEPSWQYGSTENATRSSNYPTCDDENARRRNSHVNDTAGIFYKVSGTGTAMRASVCNDETKFAALLNVYDKSCSSLGCLLRFDGERHCEFTWLSELGETYQILVYGDGERGEFAISVEAFEIAPNDLCQDAIELFPAGGENITIGSTLQAISNDNVISALPITGVHIVDWCVALTHIRIPGVWYKIQGKNRFRVALCQAFSFPVFFLA